MPAPPNLPGGQLYMEYRHLPSGERHSLRIHLAYFDPTPIDETNNRAYTSDGPVVPTDATIVDSYNSFAALWQQYYNSDWRLQCIALLQYNSFTEVVLSPTPSYPVYTGTDTTELSGKLYFERKFRLLSKTGSRRELVLAQVIDTTLRSHAFYVGASSGGVDARDQALMAYFSGASGTGFVMPDGNYAFSDTEMSVWWNKQPEGGVEGGVLSGDCLVFPEGPKVCAPDEATITFTIHTPGYPEGFGDIQHTLDIFGLLLNGGIRLNASGSQFSLDDLDGIHYIQHDGFDFVVQAQPGGEIDPSNTTARRVIDSTYYDIILRCNGIEQLHLPITVQDVDSDAAMMLVRAATVPSPFWVPYPGRSTTGTQRLGGGGDTASLGTDTCTSMRCGVSGECTKHLASLYSSWTEWLNPLIAGVTDFALFALIIDPFFDGLIAGLEVGTDLAIARAIKKTLQLGVGAITGSLFPVPSSDNLEAIQHGLFCQLACVGSTISIASKDINPVWHDYVAGLSLDGISRDLLTILIQFTPLADWQAVSLNAGASSLCDAWSCP